MSSQNCFKVLKFLAHYVMNEYYNLQEGVCGSESNYHSFYIHLHSRFTYLPLQLNFYSSYLLMNFPGFLPGDERNSSRSRRFKDMQNIVFTTEDAIVRLHTSKYP
jgi:hypothetical protein